MRIINAILALAALGLIGLSLGVTMLADQFWLLDLMTFFSPYIVVAAVLVAVASLLVRVWTTKLLALVALVLCLYPMLTLPPAPLDTPGNRLRLLTFNLYVGNADARRFVALLTRDAPDVVVTQETTRRFVDAIRGSGLYPFETTGGLVAADDKKVFSRYPIRQQAQIPDAADLIPTERHPMRLVIEGPDGPFVLYVVHPDTPRSPEQWLRRNAYFELLGRAIAAEPSQLPVLVAGDWNLPAYSPVFQRLFRVTGLRFARQGLYLPVTRYAERYKAIAYLGSAIDHVAVSPDVRVTAWRRGPDLGSNHLPVIVDLAMPSSSAVAAK